MAHETAVAGGLSCRIGRQSLLSQERRKPRDFPGLTDRLADTAAPAGEVGLFEFFLEFLQ
jgi:hypothetical protein